MVGVVAVMIAGFGLLGVDDLDCAVRGLILVIQVGVEFLDLM